MEKKSCKKQKEETNTGQVQGPNDNEQRRWLVGHWGGEMKTKPKEMGRPRAPDPHSAATAPLLWSFQIKFLKALFTVLLYQLSHLLFSLHPTLNFWF